MNYYYLIATLPDLDTDGDPTGIDFSNTFNTIENNLEPEDKNLFRYLLYPNDNSNLINEIAREQKNRKLTDIFLKPSVYKEETIKDFRDNKNSFPEYMVEFLESTEEEFGLLSMREIETKLLNLFYEEVLGLDDEFMQAYYGFDRALKSIITGYNSSVYDLKLPSDLIRDDSIPTQWGHKGHMTTVLLKTYPFIPQLTEAMDSRSPDLFEKTIDQIRWKFIDEHLGVNFFTNHAVFGYTVKLMSLQRWSRLDQQTGKTRLENISKDIIDYSNLIKSKEL